MSQTEKTIFLDDEIGQQLLHIVRDAQEIIVMVTPYLDLSEWHHLKQAVREAVDKRVRVVFVIRKDPGGLGNRSVDDVRWLFDNGVSVAWLELLHAKIYLTEKIVLVSSMNLYGFSASNSREIAMVVRNDQDAQSVRDYVFGQLLHMAQLLAVPEPTSYPPQPKDETARAIGAAGICIRCGNRIPFNHSRPLCDHCHSAWDQLRNEQYAENFCHVCGTFSLTCHAKPLCQICYQRMS